MSCEYCGKKVKENEEFILVGKYPRHRARAQIEGELYHKACFLNLMKKEIAEKEKKRE
jgi:sarcosine oxidase delta subunit